MSWTTCRSLLAGTVVAALLLSVATQSRAAIVNSTINLGPVNGAGNLGTFSANVTLGAGSQLQLGAGAINGRYQQGLLFTHTNIDFSAQNTTANLSLSPSSIGVSTSNNSGTASLDYDNLTPGTPIAIQSFSSVLSAGVVTPMTINSTGISMSTSAGTYTLTPTFSGSIKNISFSSTGSDGGTGLVPGNYSVTLNGSVSGVLNVIGINISVGTLYTLPADTVVTFAGTLPVGVALSDTGVPFGGGVSTVDKNTMLASFGANLTGITLPFAFVAPLTTSVNNSLGNTATGLKSINIQNTTLVANINLSNISYNETGKVPNALIPEPSTLALGSIALVGLFGLVARRRKVVR